MQSDWTQEELAAVRTMNLQGVKPVQIAEALGRSVHSVRGKLRRIFLGDGIYRQRGRPVAHATAQTDELFVKAMLAAIRAGSESAVIGVVKDRRPLLSVFTPKAAMTHSGCSSSAQQCADMGERGGIFADA